MSIGWEELQLPGVMLADLEMKKDTRGHFLEMFTPQLRSHLGIPDVAQANASVSREGVFRGLHFQKGIAAQGKLVFCLQGSMTDFVLDPTPSSKHFKEYLAVELEYSKPQALWVPGHYAHGFLAGEEGATVVYFVDHPRSVTDEVAINVMSTPIAERLFGRNLVISDRDKEAPSLEDVSRTLSLKTQ